MRLARPRALSAVVALGLAGCAEPSVTRVVDGRPAEGRFISGAAYALFARGAAAEAAGAFGHAIRAFELAAGEDPDSPEIWARLGALHCRAAPEGPVPAAAREAFERALTVDPDHGPTYRERARCLAGRGGAEAALADSERALALDPDDLDTALVRATVLDRLGRVPDALRALRALVARRPASTEPWLHLYDLARRTGDAALARESAERLATLAPALDPRPPEVAPLALLDRALVAGDLRAAQKAALRQRLPGAEVALRAAALGLHALAREQAELVLGADPTDAGARIALVAAADLRSDLGAISRLMTSIPRRSTPPSPLGRWLLADVLRRRVGAEAALAWLGEARGAAAEQADPLLAATEKRVLGALAGP